MGPDPRHTRATHRDAIGHFDRVHGRDIDAKYQSPAEISRKARMGRWADVDRDCAEPASEFPLMREGRCDRHKPLLPLINHTNEPEPPMLMPIPALSGH